jgi:hypothetical protein
MRKIEYPKDLLLFQSDYYDMMSKLNEIDINTFLFGTKLTFKDIITAPFEDLINYNFIIENHFTSKSALDIKAFNDSFNYTANQPSIASFFTARKDDLHLKTCYYCNIDFINSFEDFGEYKDELHFINKATIQELKLVVGKAKARLIFDALKIANIQDFDELMSIKGIGKATVDVFKLFRLTNLKKIRNHFTLDHFIPKAKFPYFALSLFNLIPSCYSCNSKFKGAMEFANISNLNSLSPSSSSFSLFKNLEFKLYFNVPGIHFKKKIKNVDTLKDIRVDIENIGSIKEFDTYLDMFKLKGRYVYHKKESLKLIHKRKIYSDTEITEIARISGRDVNDVKSDIFGSVIFSKDEINEPFAKYKIDIAKQLRLF